MCRAQSIFCCIIIALILAGCKAIGPTNSPETNRLPNLSVPTAKSTDSTSLPNGPELAFFNSQPVFWDNLRNNLVETAGGQVLAEYILDQLVQSQLAERGLGVDQQQLDNEKLLLTQTLHHDPDQAQRVLEQLKLQRGWADHRFAQLIARNAGLRLLVQGQVQVSDAAIDQAYQLEFGPRFETRLIVTQSLSQAGELLARARSGEPFIDLAVNHSIDASRARGGLLAPVSPADPTFPAAIRQSITELKPGQISDPIALDQGFALIRLEKKIDGQPIQFDDVKDTLATHVRLRIERMLMQRLAKTVLDQADVIVLNPILKQSWDQHQQRLNQGN